MSSERRSRNYNSVGSLQSAMAEVSWEHARRVGCPILVGTYVRQKARRGLEPPSLESRTCTTQQDLEALNPEHGRTRKRSPSPPSPPPPPKEQKEPKNPKPQTTKNWTLPGPFARSSGRNYRIPKTHPKAPRTHGFFWVVGLKDHIL